MRLALIPRIAVLGGPIGLAIDDGPGAMHSYTPAVQIAMTPLRGCRS